MRKRVPTGTPIHLSRPTAGTIGLWVEAGPATTVRGGPLRSLRLAGCVRALAVKDDGERIYAGSALGGLWFSSDMGDRWTALDFYATAKDAAGQERWADALTVGAVVVAFDADPAKDLVTVGPGARPATAGWEVGASAKGVGIRCATGPAPAVLQQGAGAAEPFRLEATDLEGVVVAALASDRVTAGVVWAATSMGLRKRPAGGAASWSKVDAGLGSDDVTGVVVVPGVGTEPQRIYAAGGGKVARSVDGQAWTPVPLPSRLTGTLASIPVGPVRVVAGHGVVWALADGPRLWRIDGDTAEIVAGVPPELFGVDGRVEGLPSLALAVHPDTADLIALSGASPYSPPGGGAAGAALFVGQVAKAGGAWTFPRTGPADGPPVEWVGAGLPPGLRALAWVHGVATSGTHLFAAGDCGIFRSVQDGARGSFFERNTGLAVSEPVALGGSAATEAVALAGTRRGGLLRRLSAETWEVADPEAAGGVVVVDADVRVQYAQGLNHGWRWSVDGGQTWSVLPVFGFFGAAWSMAATQEMAATAPVAPFAVIQGDGNHGRQLALGTDRIWYGDDATRGMVGSITGQGWVTLPSGTDPNPSKEPQPDQDRLAGVVIGLRWGSADRLYALTDAGVYLMARKADGSWARMQLYDQAATRSSTKLKSPAGQIPGDLDLASLAVQDAGSGTGGLLVGTAGKEGKEPLWWFDGQGNWASAGLGRDTAVHALVVDPDHPEVAYAGTDQGVFKGTYTAANTAAPWKWDPLSIGLPQAAVVDLLLVRPDGGGTPVLRAALAGRGVWELALDGRQQGLEVYLRAHALDLRRDVAVPGGAREPSRLDASPDIRLQRIVPDPPPVPVAFAAAAPWFGADADPHDVWLVKSALASAGVPMDPLTALSSDGAVRWSVDDAAALTARVATLPVAAGATALQIWDALLASHPRPFDRTDGDAADLAAWHRDEPDRFRKGRRASTAAGSMRLYDAPPVAAAERVQVRVTVHARHWRGLDPARVVVALLRTPYAMQVLGAGSYRGLRGLSAAASLPADWAAQLQAGVAALRALPAGTTALARPPLDANWSFADAGHALRVLPGRLDPVHPQVVTFEVDLADPIFDKGWLLVAVVLADDDPLPAAVTAITSLPALVSDRRVAARSVRRENRFGEAGTRLAGVDIGEYPGALTSTRLFTRSNAAWTAMYLDSPRREPALGDNEPPFNPVTGEHNGHRRDGGGLWMNAWPVLVGDWGLLPIYWGQQGAGAGDGPKHLTVPLGEANAVDAAAKAAAAGIPPGAVIYLDYEDSGALDVNAPGYCRAFYGRLGALGYRPGIYGHGVVGVGVLPGATVRLRQEVPGLVVWNVRYRPVPPANGWRVTRGRLVLDTSKPVALDDPEAILRQWAQDTTLPALGAANPVPGYLPDLDLGFLQDPGFPERAPLPAEIRFGRAAVTSADPDVAIHAVRRGAAARVRWHLGTVGPRTVVTDPGDGIALNPFVAPVALRLPTGGAGPFTDWLLGFGAASDGDPGDQRVQALRHAPTLPWELTTVPDAGLVLDPLPGLAAAARSDGSLEVFAVDEDTGQLAGARFTAGRGWSTLSLLPGGEPVLRSQGLAAVGRDPGMLHLFWVSAAGELRTSTSSAPGTWDAATTLAGGGAGAAAALAVHPLSRLAAVSGGPDRVDVFFVGAAVGTTDWRLCVATFLSARGWAGAVPVGLGSAAGGVEPLAPLSACARDASHVDGFVCGHDGALHQSTLNAAGSAFSDLTLATAGPPTGIRAIEGVVSLTGHDMQVVVTARDGNVYASEWLDVRGFSGFNRVPPLDP